jgi:hypothetical protein
VAGVAVAEVVAEDAVAEDAVAEDVIVVGAAVFADASGDAVERAADAAVPSAGGAGRCRAAASALTSACTRRRVW